MKSEVERQRRRFGAPFESRLVRRDNGCLEWTGPTDRDGYGLRGSRFGERRAHRYAYVTAHGDIPPGMVVMHSCDNPRCCNSAHLSLGDQSANMADKVAKERQARGERNVHARLTADEVLAVRAAHKRGVTQQEIAGEYGVTQSAISLIVLRKNWRHV